MRLALIASALLLGACTTPTPTAMNESGVSIRYDDALYSRETVSAQADEVCRSYGREAVFRTTAKEHFAGFRYDHFDCVKR